MPKRPASARLRRTIRNLPVATSVLTRRVDGPTTDVVSGLLRAAPGPVRAVAGRGRDRTPVTTALAAAAAGEPRTARAHLATGIERATHPRDLRRLLEAAITLHEPDLARTALDRLDPQDPEHDWCASLVAAEEGHLGEAVRLLDATARRRDSTRVRRVRRRLRGQLEVLHPRLPARPPRAPRLPADGPGTVLHVVKNSLPEVQAGYTLRTHGLATAQVAAGLDVHVVTRLGFPVDIGRPDAEPVVEVDGVTYHRLLPSGTLPAPGGATIGRTAQEIVALGRRIGADVVHAHSDHPQAQAAIRAARTLGVPVVYEVRGMLEQTWVSRGGDPDADLVRWSRAAETSCMQAADGVVVLSEAMREDVVGRGVDPDRVTVVPNAVAPGVLADLQTARADDEGRRVRERVRADLRLTPDTVLVGCVTTLNHYEGLDVLLEALARVTHSSPVGAAPLAALVVGAGPAAEGLAEQAARLGIEDHVHLPGPVRHDRVAEHLLALDVVTLPRRSTPVTRLVPPLKPLEAYAAGRPVLASDLPPLAEILTSALGARAGRWLIAPDDVDAWAGGLASLRYARADTEADAGTARARVLAERTWPTLASVYSEIYQGVGRPRAGDPRPDAP